MLIRDMSFAFVGTVKYARYEELGRRHETHPAFIKMLLFGVPITKLSFFLKIQFVIDNFSSEFG